VDEVAGLLDGPRARSAFLLRSVMAAPWSLGIRDEAPLTVVAVVRGTACLQQDGQSWTMLTGDVAVVCGPVPYTVSDSPDRPVQAVILPGQQCVAPDGGPQDAMGWVGMRAWGNSPDGETELLTGTYTVSRAVSQRLLQALPPVLVLPASEADGRLVTLLAEEIQKDLPGQEAVLDRLLDLLLVAVLRAWFARAPAPAWYQAYDDPVVGPAVRHLQAAPQQNWTLTELASTCGVSRSALARQFKTVTGESPMAFLASWRLALAADLLCESTATLDAVARQVGYSNAFALSTAFKREFGMSPRQYRGSRVAAG
jgi:AraC-like DNA-binding protein